MRLSLLPILMIMVVLSPLAIDIYLPSMPVMADEFGVSNTEIQSTLVLFMLAMGVGQILVGPLADRFGRKPIAIFGIILYILSSLLAANVTDFQHLLIARIIQGLAACATSIVVFSAVRDTFPAKESAYYYSYLNGLICVIPALAPTLGGLLALQFGWRSTFIFMMLYAIVVLIIVVLKLPETRPKTTVTTKALYRWASYQPMLTNSHFVFYAVCCMVAMASILTYVSYSPGWVIKHLGIAELSFSYLFGFNALINIAACFIAPKVIKKLGNRPTVLCALWLMIASAVLQLILQQLPVESSLTAALYFMLPMILLCIGFALLLGPATSMALSGFGQRAGTATAILGCIQMGGAALLTALIQQTDLSAPYASALMIGGGASVLLLAMSLSRLSHWHVEQVHY